MLYEHRAFRVEASGRNLVFLPTLKKVYEVPSSKIRYVPESIFSEDPLPKIEETSAVEYGFTGAVFIITQSCNLKCAYCYEDNGPQRPFVAIDWQTIKGTVDFIIGNALQLGRNRIKINFFGGEPTQAFDLVKEATLYARKAASENGLKARISITTNGVFGSNISKWIIDAMDGINISLDGPAEIHNTHRDNSFERAFESAKSVFLANPQKLSFRSTVSDFSVHALPDIVDFFGKNFPGRPVLFEPLFAIGRGGTNKLKTPEMKAFFDGFIESLPIALRHGLKIRTSVLNISSLKASFCGASGGNFLVTPQGEVSSCNRMAIGGEVAQPEFIFGRYDKDVARFVFDKEKYQNLRNFNVNSVQECRDCFAKYSCRADCVANKAVIDPQGFSKNPSYRCQEIKEFTARLLLASIDDKKIASLL